MQYPGRNGPGLPPQKNARNVEIWLIVGLIKLIVDLTNLLIFD